MPPSASPFAQPATAEVIGEFPPSDPATPGPAPIVLGRLAEFEPPLATMASTELAVPPRDRGGTRASRRWEAPAAAPTSYSRPNTEVARRLLNAVCEVLDGRRPLRQVGPLLSLPVQEAIRTRVRRRGVVDTALRLRSLRTCSPAPDVIEVCATLTCGPRVRAAAARIEVRHGSWLCTALRVL